jgi:uncharacterized protein
MRMRRHNGGRLYSARDWNRFLECHHCTCIDLLEVFYIEGRVGEVRTAGESMVVYERWRRLKDNTLLRQIAEYNESDCRSTTLLRDWLLELWPEGAPWFNPASALPDEDMVRERQEAIARRAGFERALLAGVTGEEQRLRELVCYLLEFHRREAKPGWGAMLDRRDKSEEELIDDPECLGGLHLDRGVPVTAVARSKIFTFRFRPQECKLGPGDAVLDARTLEPFGTVYALDDSECLGQIKRSSRLGDSPPAASVIPTGPINSKLLGDAIARFAGSVISGGGRYRAIRSLLEHRIPRVKGIDPGAPLVDQARDLIDECKSVVAGLSESHIFIQGPPGSGKTYTTSHVILDRIRAGKRIGVASNSHKAINNLLSAVSFRRPSMAAGCCRGSAEPSPDPGVGRRLAHGIVTQRHQVRSRRARRLLAEERGGGCRRRRDVSLLQQHFRAYNRL